MTIKEAREVLEAMDPQVVRDSGGLMAMRKGANFVWDKNFAEVAYIEGHFTARQLTAIAVWMVEYSK